MEDHRHSTVAARAVHGVRAGYGPVVFCSSAHSSSALEILYSVIECISRPLCKQKQMSNMHVNRMYVA